MSEVQREKSTEYITMNERESGSNLLAEFSVTVEEYNKLIMNQESVH